MTKEQERSNNQTYQNNLAKLNNRVPNAPNSGKTSAEIAAEQWDSWLSNPDDFEKKQ